MNEQSVKKPNTAKIIMKRELFKSNRIYCNMHEHNNS